MAVQPRSLTQYASATQAGVATLDTNFAEVGSQSLCYAGTASGAPNALVLSIPLALADYYIGMKVEFVALANNTGASTVQVIAGGTSLATVPLVDFSGTALTANAIVANNVYQGVAVFNSNALAFRLAGSGVSAPVSSVFGRTGAIVATNGDYSIGQISGAGSMASQNSGSVAITGGSIAGVSASNINGTQVARAWVHFAGNTVLKSYNVTSFNQTAGGAITWSFVTNLADTNWGITFGGDSVKHQVYLNQGSSTISAGSAQGYDSTTAGSIQVAGTLTIWD